MKETLHLRATVLPGGKIEIQNGALREGESVEVVVTRPDTARRASILDVIADAPARRMFKTGEEVDAYIRSERDAWGI